MNCKTYPVNTLGNYKFVVILSTYGDKIMLSRHKDRTTWETQGGHVEAGETELEAAERELYEESGALEYSIRPLFDYQAGDAGTETNGMAFAARINKLGPLPESEMKEVVFFDELPEQLTYPGITPVLFRDAGIPNRENSERENSKTIRIAEQGEK